MKESLYIPLDGILPNLTGSEASLSAESDSRSEFAHQIRDKVDASAYRRKAEGSSAFGPETASPAATRGYAGSVAVGVDHPDTSYLM